MKTSYELFGVECGPGWRKLIEPIIDACEKEGVAIYQIKEKMGGLRFYTGAAPRRISTGLLTGRRKKKQRAGLMGFLTGYFVGSYANKDNHFVKLGEMRK